MFVSWLCLLDWQFCCLVCFGFGVSVCFDWFALVLRSGLDDLSSRVGWLYVWGDWVCLFQYCLCFVLYLLFCLILFYVITLGL